MRILITGASGFIGHHVVEHFLRTTDHELVLLDGLHYAADPSRLTDINCWAYEKHRCVPVYHDLEQPLTEGARERLGDVDAILHLAAHTHVDRSMKDAAAFVRANVLGTTHLLDYARALPALRKMVVISTDEVYGPAADGVFFREDAPFRPSNPYAGSKVGAEAMALSFHAAHGVPVLVTRTMNNFGERQNKEKFIPTVIRNVMLGQEVPLYADGEGNQAYRTWLHARNHASALAFLIDHGVPGEIYNVVGEKEYDNLTLAKLIAGYVGKELKVRYVGFYGARPGHDRRYAVDPSKLNALGWRPPMNVEDSLRKTVEWSVARPNWVGVSSAVEVHA